MAKHGGFPGGMPGMNMNNIMKQYQRMQRKLEETQEELAKKEYTGQAGGGAVKATVTGAKVLTKLELDKDAVDPEDVETLEDMIVAAVNEALRKADSSMAEGMSKITGSLGSLGGLGGLGL